MKRRKSYRTHIHQNSYFTVHALEVFLAAALPRHIHRGDRVADLGCGESPLKPEIEALGARYLGLDIEAHASGHTAIVAAITELPLQTAAFDVVLCTEVLEHVYDAARALREIGRVLRPGGLAIVTTPFFYPLHEEPYDFGRPTPYFLEKACGEAGLQILELHKLGDEMQVAALALDTAWTRLTLPGPAHQLWRAARVPLRLGGNLFYGALSLALGGVLPRQAYLGHALIARKKAGNDSSP